MKQKTIQTILYAALIIFALMSALTTFIGVNLVMSSFDQIVRWVLAAGIAIGTSLMMVYLGIRAADFIGKGQILSISIGYMFIASLSVFFNFHTFYGGQTLSVSLVEDAKMIRKEVISISKKSKEEIEKVYGLNDLTKKVSEEKASMDAEEYHNNRPGRGAEHQTLKEKWMKSSEELKVKKGKISDELALIELEANKAIEALNLAIENEETNKLKSSIDKGLESYDNISSVIETKVPSFKSKPIRIESQYVERPDYIVKAIMDFFSPNKTLSSENKARFYFSMFLSILLDFPIFITLLVVGNRSSPRGRGRHVDNTINQETSTGKKLEEFWK